MAPAVQRLQQQEEEEEATQPSTSPETVPREFFLGSTEVEHHKERVRTPLSKPLVLATAPRAESTAEVAH
jgi:hypothetical protein